MRMKSWSWGLLACAWAAACDPTERSLPPAAPASVRQVPPPTISDLKAELQQGSPVRRLAAARAFPGLGREAEAAVPLLVESLRDEDASVVDALRRALDAIPPAARSSVLRLRCSLRDGFAAVRLGAAEALARMGSEAAEAAPELIGCLGDRDCSVRIAAAYALVKIGPKAVPPLLEALADHEPGLGRPIVQALGRIVPDGAEALTSLGQPAIEQLLARDE